MMKPWIRKNMRWHPPPLLNEFYAIKKQLSQEFFNCGLRFIEYSTYVQTKIGFKTKHQPRDRACDLECFQKRTQD